VGYGVVGHADCAHLARGVQALQHLPCARACACARARTAGGCA
jgi:hypothetical protein